MYKKDGRWSYMEFALEKELMMIGRLLIAGLCGGVIGHERENRRKPAGVRTHTVVGVASALMMLISKYGFNDVLNEYTKLDPSRVAAGVVTAIGFLGSGMIIARNKSVSGITTSAGIWATVGVGLAVGSGMIYLGIATSVIVVLVEMFLGRGGSMGLHREAMSAVNVEISGGQKELLELKACIGEAAVDHRTGSEREAVAVNIKWHLTRFGVWWQPCKYERIEALEHIVAYESRPQVKPAGGNCFYKSVLSEVIKESMYWI